MPQALFDLEEVVGDTCLLRSGMRGGNSSRDRSSMPSSSGPTEQYARTKDTRGLLASAFGYAVRQQQDCVASSTTAGCR